MWIAQEVGAHQTSVSRWIVSGAIPPLPQAVKLHEIVGIEPDEWLIAEEADSTISVTGESPEAEAS